MRPRSFRLVAIGLTAGVLSCSCGSSDEMVSPERWALTMSDEFDGEEGAPPDQTIWTYDIGGDGWGNQQLEFNTNHLENVSLDGEGHLRIVAREESFMGNDYTSGRIKTQGLFEQEHGRFEARIKLPEGQGLWPAFWMLGANIEEVDWPECGEIDILEYQGQRPERVFGSVHGPGYSGDQAISRGFELSEGETFSGDFHVFAVEWDPGRIAIAVDAQVVDGQVVGGTVYNIVRSADVRARGEWVFNQDFFILLNLAVGGTVGGPVGPDTVFPAEMLVDYVRIYERVP